MKKIIFIICSLLLSFSFLANAQESYVLEKDKTHEGRLEIKDKKNITIDGTVERVQIILSDEYKKKLNRADESIKVVVNGDITQELEVGERHQRTGFSSDIIINGKIGWIRSTSGSVVVEESGFVRGIETTSSDILVKGRCGIVKSTSGNVDIEGVLKGRVNTTSGNITARNIIGGAKTTSGNITILENITLDIATTSGDIKIKNAGRNINTTSGNITVSGTVEGGINTTSGDINLNGGVVNGGVNTVSGNLNGNGVVNNGFSSISGDVNMAGTIHGDVSTTSGDIKKGVVVKGDFSTISGDTKKDAVIEGDITSVSGVIGSFLDIAQDLTYKDHDGHQIISGFKMGGISVASLFLIISNGIICLIILFFLKKYASRMVASMETDFLKSFFVGILFTLVLSPGLILVLLTGIGILLIPFLIMAIIIIYLLGLTGFSLLVSKKVFEKLEKKEYKFPYNFVCGYLLLNSFFIIAPLLILSNIGVLKFIGSIFLLIGLFILFIGVSTGVGSVFINRK